MIQVRAFVAASLLLLAGCSTMPVEHSANESCNLPPNVWHQIATPSNREFLLGLPEPSGRRPVGERLGFSAVQREAWLEDSNGNLQACIYNPMKPLSCYSGELTTVVFTKTEASWMAGPTTQHICTD
jgi:hypothetical protein